MGRANNGLYFTCSTIVRASRRPPFLYGEEMSGFWRNWAFYVCVYSARSAAPWDLLGVGWGGGGGGRRLTRFLLRSAYEEPLK